MSAPLASSVLFSRLLARARLRHLQLLVGVADHGSVKRAAAEVGVSQPAATQALAELEHLIEQPLFERHSRGMRLTPAGRTLIPMMRSVLETIESSAESLAALQEGASSVLHVGAIPALTMIIVGEGVQQMCGRRPELRLEVVEDSQPHLIQELLAGSLDLVLCRRPDGLPDRLRFVPEGHEQVVVVCGRGHELVGRQGLSLPALADRVWIRAGRGLWTREVFDRAMAGAAIRPRLYPVTTSSVGPLLNLLSDDSSLAMAPARLARPLQRRGLLQVLDVPVPGPPSEIGVVCSATALALPLHRELIAALRLAF